jgi:hypothetical protein
MLKDAFSTWHTLQSEMKEATKLSCEEAALKLGGRAPVASPLKRKENKVILHSKGGKK